MRGLQYGDKYANFPTLFEKPRNPDRLVSSAELVELRHGEGGACCYGSRCYSNIKITLGK